jgi:DNA-directed RNA polymerase subunit RPC12/RpoP
MNIDDAWRAIAASIAGRPATVYRCARCGARVGSYNPGPGRTRNYAVNPAAPLECPTHGRLDDKRPAKRREAHGRATEYLNPIQ